MSVITYRRDLHQIPELDRDLLETTAYVKAVLQKLPCQLSEPVPGAVCAFFDKGRGDAVAFRADMDALPVTETTRAIYASRHPGRMHACGHDGHTAMALALAEWAADRDLPHDLLLIFQPAEETTGGAEDICQAGVFEAHRVRRVFGLHIWPSLPEGGVWTRPGPLMARSSEISFFADGKSVHISKAAEGRDALWAGGMFLHRAYALSAAHENHILRFGRMESGTVRNAISGHTELLGSLRSFDEGTFAAMKEGLARIAGEVGRETGCSCRLTVSAGYPPVRNDIALLSAVERYLGADEPRRLDAPSLAAEDFSFYQQKVPGVFFFLGAGDVPALHAPDFHFPDELVLPKGLAFLCRLAEMP